MQKGAVDRLSVSAVHFYKILSKGYCDVLLLVKTTEMLPKRYWFSLISSSSVTSITLIRLNMHKVLVTSPLELLYRNTKIYKTAEI